MKTPISFLVVILFVAISCASKTSNCDNVVLDGYLVTRLIRNEVESYYSSMERKAQGKSYSRSVDSYHETYFIPKDSVGNDGELLSIIYNHRHSKDKCVFLLPSNETKSNIARFCSQEIKEEIREYVLSTDRYFEIEADSAHKYLYNVRLLRGSSVYSKVDNTFFNRRYLGVHVVDKGLAQFECFFIYAMSIKDNVELGEGFRKVDFGGEVQVVGPMK